jgi:UDP-N-acetylglucosamine 2-epimerase (non-hydrolysing)
MRASQCGLANVRLSDPLPYPELIGIMANAYAILSDSGGLQEEAPSFGVPVLVLRNVTERPEGVERGHNRIVGTDRLAIVEAFDELARSGIDYEARRALGNPYGDGKSGERIARQINEDCA